MTAYHGFEARTGTVQMDDAACAALVEGLMKGPAA